MNNQTLQKANSAVSSYLYDEPNMCPYCKSKIVAIFRKGYVNAENIAICTYQCTNSDCQEPFFAYYNYEGTHTNGSTRKYRFSHAMKGPIINREFSELINDISDKFSKIYNQANEAENTNLDEIAGMGYRKAVEFLIKDYCIKNNPTEEDNIKSKLLGQCINEFVDNEKIKEIAKRAVWLGNDETHYERRWETKDIEDLKKLIDITIHWIEMEQLTEDYLSDM